MHEYIDLECDIGNTTGNLINHDILSSSDLPTDLLSKLSLISPSNQYYYLNDFLESSLISLGTDYGMGMAIVAITVGIKLIYTQIGRASCRERV